MMQREGVDSDDEDGDIPTVDGEWVISEEDDEANSEESGERRVLTVFTSSTKYRVHLVRLSGTGRHMPSLSSQELGTAHRELG